MSITKRRMEREQELYGMGVQLCIEVGALAECEYHEGTYFDGGSEVEDAYKLAAARVAKGDIEITGNENQRTVTDAVKSAYEDNRYADSCMACEAIFSKDD